MYGMYGFTSNGFFSGTLFTQTEEGQFGIKNELTSEAPFGQYLLPVFSKNTITSNFDTRNASGEILRVHNQWPLLTEQHR